MSETGHPAWEPVYSTVAAHRVVLYWRYHYPAGASIGAISRRSVHNLIVSSDRNTAFWRALGYSRDGSPAKELGHFPTRHGAEVAVVTYWRESWLINA